MTRILWHSGAPWCATGYGNQTALFTPRLSDLGHQVAISAFWGLDGATLEYEGMPVYPSDHRFGNVLLPAFAERHQADLVIALLDAWVLQPAVMGQLPLAVWCPVDHQPCPPKVAEFFHKSRARPIAMSRFGERMLHDEGLDPLYVPHGVDTSIFRPLDRDLIRQAAGIEDRFLVGIVANNSGGMPPTSGPPRKAFPQMLMAFAAFHRNHPEAMLYLHSEMTGRPGLENGLHLGHLLDRFEIPLEAVKFTDQVALETGLGAQAMAALYNSFDVLLNTSYGEGFGIPIIEAQACSTPVIVSDWTAMTELCGAGWKVDGEPWFDPVGDAFYLSPQVGLILEALEDAHDKAAGMRGAAREFALAYDADQVTQQFWLPALEALSRPKEIPALPNRARRRAAKKAGVAA